MIFLVFFRIDFLLFEIDSLFFFAFGIGFLSGFVGIDYLVIFFYGEGVLFNMGVSYKFVLALVC